MRPWELREYSFDELIHHLRGFQRQEASEWDRTRHIMFAVANSAGAKIKDVQRIMHVPLLDENEERQSIRQNLIDRLNEKRNARSGT